MRYYYYFISEKIKGIFVQGHINSKGQNQNLIPGLWDSKGIDTSLLGQNKPSRVFSKNMWEVYS